MGLDPINVYRDPEHELVDTNHTAQMIEWSRIKRGRRERTCAGARRLGILLFVVLVFLPTAARGQPASQVVTDRIWLLVVAPTLAHSLNDEPLWFAQPGEWYFVLYRESGWALAVWEFDPPTNVVWIQLDARVQLFRETIRPAPTSTSVPTPTPTRVPTATPRPLPRPLDSDLSVQLTSIYRWDRNWVTVNGEVCNNARGWRAIAIEISFYYTDPSGIRWDSYTSARPSDLRPGACDSFSESLFEVFDIRAVGIREVTWTWRAA